MSNAVRGRAGWSARDPVHGFLEVGAAGPVAVGRVIPVGPSEGYAEQHGLTLGDIEEVAHEGRVRRQGRLRDGAQAQSGSSEEEVRDVDTGVEHAVGALARVDGNHDG